MGVIRRSFTYLDKSSFTKLYKALVRPHLEYASPVWHPRYKKFKSLIENVQRRSTKALSCCKNMDYIERLKYLNLPCMAYRKIRGDMIEVYKITSHKYDQDITAPLRYHKSTSHHTRGNSKKLTKDINRSSKSTRKISFSNRVVNMWNELPDTVVNAPSLYSFEARLDKFWLKYGIKFDFDKCVQFEIQKLNGVGTANMIILQDIDLEIQAT